VLGASTVRTGYAPYAVSRLAGLKAEKETEVILTTDPRIYHAGLARVGPRAHQGADRPSPTRAQADEVLGNVARV
jgi:hypothetical protein